MKRFVFTATAVVSLIVLCNTVYAADLTPRPAPAPVAPPVPYYNWTGIYIGINGGGAWGQQDPFNIITDRFDKFSTDISGGVVGGTMGAQVQVSHVVLGVEADIDWASIKGSATATPTIGGVPDPAGAVTANTKIDWESTARFRVGYANDNWLLYSTGGLALLGAKTNLTTPGGGCVSTVLNGGCSGSNRQVGAALGGGLEYGFTPNLSGKIEYLYIAAASLEISRHSEVRAGLNYRFGGL